MSEEQATATVDEALRLGGGLQPGERDDVVARLGSLDARLRSFRPDAVEMVLTIKERDQPSQRTTLEMWIAGQDRIVATSTKTGFGEAIKEVRDDLLRQVTDAKNRREPRNTRRLRDKDV